MWSLPSQYVSVVSLTSSMPNDESCVPNETEKNMSWPGASSKRAHASMVNESIAVRVKSGPPAMDTKLLAPPSNTSA